MKDRAFEIARNHNYDGYQRALASIVYKFFGKKIGLAEQLAEELHKPVIKILKEESLCQI